MQKVHCLSWPGNVIRSALASSRTTLEQPSQLHHIVSTTSNLYFSPLATTRRPWLNHHSKPVLLGWRANVDLQPILGPDTAIKYTSKYASEPETIFGRYHLALDNFLCRDSSRPPRRKTPSGASSPGWPQTGTSPSAQEAVHTATISSTHFLGNHNKVDDDDPAFEASRLPATKHARPLRRI